MALVPVHLHDGTSHLHGLAKRRTHCGAEAAAAQLGGCQIEHAEWPWQSYSKENVRVYPMNIGNHC